MKIAHLSDFHLCSYFADSNQSAILDVLHYCLLLNPDHIVITGDLTENADERDFETLRDIFKKLNLLNSDRLSIVIGNHDIFGGLVTAEDIFTFPQRCKKTNYTQKVRKFYEYFSETFEHTVYRSKNIFPYAKIINDTLITGANSIDTYSKMRNPFASNGFIEDEQFNELQDIFLRFRRFAENAVLLIHHHFNKIASLKSNALSGLWHNIEKQTMKLRGKKRIHSLLLNHKVNVVLHGHVHQNHEYRINNIPFLNSGASIKGGIHANIIEFLPTGLKTEIHSIESTLGRVIHSAFTPKSNAVTAELPLKATVNF